MTNAVVEAIATKLGDLVQRDVSIGSRTTYRVGGSAALFCEVESEEQLLRVAQVVAVHPFPTLVMGNGSNLLIHDGGFDGLAVHLGDAFSEITVSGTTVWAGGGVSLPVLARQSVAVSLTGLEWAVGVPGSVGGAVRMNAGGHGADTAATLTRIGIVDFHTGEFIEKTNEELNLAYRSSNVEAHQLVEWAEYELAAGEREQSEETLREIVRWRREHQPGGQNAGSVFTNPPGDSAGRLIDAAGLRGLRLRSAQVSEKHANFIQADPDGKATDVWELIQTIRTRVSEVFDIDLHPEVRLVGFPDAEATNG